MGAGSGNVSGMNAYGAGAGGVGTDVSAGCAVCACGLHTLAVKPVETGGMSGTYAGGLLGESGLDGGRPCVEAKSGERSDVSTGDCKSEGNRNSLSAPGVPNGDEAGGGEFELEGKKWPLASRWGSLCDSLVDEGGWVLLLSLFYGQWHACDACS